LSEAITRRNSQTLSLNFGSDLLQSCMRLDDPHALLLEYTRAMMGFLLLDPAPARVLMVGLGGGSIAKYCHLHLPHTHLTVVEISEDVIALRDEFLIPPDDARLDIVCADGSTFMAQGVEPFDAILIDGFTAEGQPPALSSPAFYRHCARRLKAEGVLIINLHAAEPALSQHLKRLNKVMGSGVFDIAVDDGDNRVVLAAADGTWQRCIADFEARWQALAPTHQITLGSSSGRLERALRRRYPARLTE
jgi:spermidine synthase